jgi:hypothetical protein
MKGACPGRALLAPPKKEFDEEYITQTALASKMKDYIPRKEWITD